MSPAPKHKWNLKPAICIFHLLWPGPVITIVLVDSEFSNITKPKFLQSKYIWEWENDCELNWKKPIYWKLYIRNSYKIHLIPYVGIGSLATLVLILLLRATELVAKKANFGYLYWPAFHCYCGKILTDVNRCCKNRLVSVSNCAYSAYALKLIFFPKDFSLTFKINTVLKLSSL